MDGRIRSIHLTTNYGASIDKYPAKQHTQAVATKLGVDDGLIYLLGQYEFPIEDSDQSKTWRQRRYFYYCSGVDEPNCCLTYDIKTDHLTLYIPEIKPERVIWMGRGSTKQEAEDKYDVDTVRFNAQLSPDLAHWKTQNPKSTFYILHKDHRPADKLFEPPNVDSERLMRAVDLCRVIKDSHEIALIRRANEISASAHRAVLEHLSKFKNEAQIEGLFTDVCISKKAKQAYGVIAGSGANASTLHYMDNNQPLKNRQLVCLDAGSECQLYASDVTRTFPISGSLSKEAREIYAIVQDMQESCIEKLKPGVRMFDLHLLAHRIAIEGLLKLGVFEGASFDELYETGASRAFYPHGLGHHVGLEVHDVLNLPILKYSKKEDSVPDARSWLSRCRQDNPELEEGMVITIEPGVYFCQYELERFWLSSPLYSKYINKEVLKKYYPVGGVRIEDDLLITANGYENLTTAPKGEAAFEIIRNGPITNECLVCGDYV